MADAFPIEIRLLSEARYLCAVRGAIQAASERLGLGEKGCGEAVLAVDEALTNIIRHGYKGQADQPIWVRLRPIEQAGCRGLEIVVEDQCVGCELSHIRGRDLENVRPGGLGVHIIRSAMDEVTYEHRDPGPGVRLRMRKYQQSDEPACNTASRGRGEAGSAENSGPSSGR